MTHALGSNSVGEFEIAFGKLEDGNVGFGTFSKRAQLLRKTERSRGIFRRSLDHLLERQAEVQELRQGGSQIKDGSVVVELV